RDARGEIDEAVAVDVLDDGSGGSRGDDGMEVRDAERDGRRSALEPLVALRPRDLGDDLPFLRDVHRASSSGCETAARRSARGYPTVVARVSAGAVPGAFQHVPDRSLGAHRVALPGENARYWRAYIGSKGFS